MNPDPDDIERMLEARRHLQAPKAVPPDLAWRLAAGEPVAEQPAREVLRDADALRELAVASAVLEVRGRAHADAARSADAVLERIGMQRRRWRWAILAGGGLLAAAAVFCLYLLTSTGDRLRWGVHVETRASRGGTEQLFRVELQPAVPSAPIVWLLYEGEHGVEVQRLHPLPPDQESSPEFAGWPRGLLPIATPTLLPPAGIEPFPMPAKHGVLVLATLRGVVPDEAAVLRLQAIVTTAMAPGLNDASLAAARGGLTGAGATVDTKPVD